MAGPETQWIRADASKMDRPLRRKALECYRPPRFIPCWFSRYVIAWRRRYARLPVIIQMQTHCSEEDRSQLMTHLHGHRCKHVRDLALVVSIGAHVPLGMLPELLRDARVRRICDDRPVQALLDVAAPTVLAPRLWETGITGEGVTVAVIDTGIHPHRDFTVPQNRIVAFKDFVGNRTDPYDDNGHGTHVAGIVGASGSKSNGKYKGMAPSAGLVGVKVLNALGSGNLSGVIEGIQWSVEHKEEFKIRVLNLSLGSPAEDSYRDDPAAQAVGAAWEAGLVVCAAAGNEGPDARTIASPGIHPRIITVGASDDRETRERSDDRVADFSSRGPTIDDLPKPDLVAPGANITSTNSPKSTLALQQGQKNADYITLSGTSMATPVCSGIAALILQDEPSLTPDQVKSRLLDSAQSLGADINAEGKGLVDAQAAVGQKGEAQTQTQL